MGERDNVSEPAHDDLLRAARALGNGNAKGARSRLARLLARAASLDVAEEVRAKLLGETPSMAKETPHG